MKIKLLLVSIIISGIILAQESTRIVKFKTFWNVETDLNSYWQNTKLYSFSQGKYMDVDQHHSVIKLDSYFSFAVEVNSKNNDNFHEFELKKVKINARDETITYSLDSVNYNISGDERVDLEASVNYEYNFRIFKKSKNAYTYIGLGANPYVSSYRKTPVSSNEFFSSVTQKGVNLSIVPRVKFRIDKKIGFELKLQAVVLNIQNTSTNNENPLLQVAERKTSETYLGTFSGSGYSRVSFGINYKI